jgi:hypothetical protein
VALLDEPGGQTDALGQHHRCAGVCLETMRPVWVHVANPEHVQTHEAAARLLGELCVPGVASLLTSGTAATGEPYFVIASSGRELEPLLAEGPELTEALRICRDGVQILAALGTAGIELPDAAPRRFRCETSGALLLTDLAGARRVGTESAEAAQLELARTWCLHVLGEARGYVAPTELVDAIPAAKRFADLARIFARSLQRNDDGS